MQDDIEQAPEPVKPAAVSRAGAKKAKRERRKNKQQTPKSSRKMRGKKVQP